MCLPSVRVQTGSWQYVMSGTGIASLLCFLNIRKMSVTEYIQAQVGLANIQKKLIISYQTSRYCSPNGMECSRQYPKELFNCEVSCTGLYVDVEDKNIIFSHLTTLRHDGIILLSFNWGALEGP